MRAVAIIVKIQKIKKNQILVIIKVVIHKKTVIKLRQI